VDGRVGKTRAGRVSSLATSKWCVSQAMLQRPLKSPRWHGSASRIEASVPRSIGCSRPRRSFGGSSPSSPSHAPFGWRGVRCHPSEGQSRHNHARPPCEDRGAFRPADSALRAVRFHAQKSGRFQELEECSFPDRHGRGRNDQRWFEFGIFVRGPQRHSVVRRLIRLGLILHGSFAAGINGHWLFVVSPNVFGAVFRRARPVGSWACLIFFCLSLVHSGPDLARSRG
jgi:hypothetical protein